MFYRPTPLIEISDVLLSEAGVRLLVKREDLNHPAVSGNKWWKLKYNLDEARRQGKTTLLTFGGAYSNHILATAAAAKENGFHAIGMIRGEETLPLNPTLQFAEAQGMQLHYCTRAQYREKESTTFLEELSFRFGDFYLIPEGGTNSLALKGCAEYAAEELYKIDFDHLFLPVGTGGTMAGIIAGFNGTKMITGISVLKEGAFLTDEVETLLTKYNGLHYSNWKILTDYHEGGYAKTTDRLRDLISRMKKTHGLQLDHVYTGKMILAIYSEVIAGRITRGTTLLALHTGGLQASTLQG